MKALRDLLILWPEYSADHYKQSVKALFDARLSLEAMNREFDKAVHNMSPLGNYSQLDPKSLIELLDVQSANSEKASASDR